MSERPVAVVIGGTGYLGDAIVRAFRDGGWDAVAASRSSEDIHDRVDVTSRDSVRALMEQVRTKRGRIDAVVHAASPRLERVKPGAATSTAHAEVTVEGTKHAIDEAVAHHVPIVIVVTSEAAASDPERLSMGSYPNAKRAQEELVAASSAEHPGTLFFTVAPGFLPGGLNSDLPAAIQHAFSKRPDGGTNTREEVARTILAIATDRERYLTSGRVRPVDGTHAPF